MSRNIRLVGIGFAVVILGFIALQLIPYRALAARTNPPVKTHIVWDSPQTEQLVRTACYDCHSNETVWPWYAYIAPSSWLVSHDVVEARDRLNFSEETADQIDPSELVQQIRSGKMPDRKYLLLHPSASLNDTQKAQLIAGLTASLTGKRR